MPDTPHLDELLSRWLTMRDAGRPVSAEELCSDCPELLPEVRRRLDWLANEEAVTEATRITTSGAMPAEPTVEPGAAEPDRPYDLSFLQPPRGAGELGWLGPYRVLRVLGSGGMGIVLLGEDVTLERPVALKVMLPRVAADPAAKGRFLREARAAARVRHPGVVTIYQVGEADGCPFIAMELLHGLPLDRWLNQHPWPAVPFIVRVGREAAEALAAAHEQGLVHRDIKPANLWLEAPPGRVKLLDFGLARTVDHEAHLTGSGVVVGTPAYMAPEQARNLPVDARTDLFSLGCLLYRLCTGAPPFRGDTAVAVLTALALDRPAPLRERNPGVPPALEALVLQLLEKVPDRRPASAQAVAEALRHIEGEADPPTLPIPVADRVEDTAWADLTNPDPTPTVPAEPAHSAPVKSGRRSRLTVVVAALTLTVAVVAAALLTRAREAVVAIDSPEAGVPVVFVADDGRQTVVHSAEARLPEGHYRVRLGDGVQGLELAAGEVTARRGAPASVELRRPAARAAPRPRPTPPALKRGPVDDDWVRQVRALKGEQRARAVYAKLAELNPGLKPGRYEIKGDGVDAVSFEGATNLTPLRALPELDRISATGAPLRDLTPLVGLKLSEFCAAGTAVTDLAPLRGMPLVSVFLDNTPVTDLGPVAAPTLQRLHVYGCGRLADLSPVAGCPLTSLVCQDSGVRDLSVCRALPLVELYYNYHPGDWIGPLRGHPTLRTVGGARSYSVEAFWAMVDTEQSRFDAWVTATAAVPARQQIAAVADKLREHNPGFDGKLEPTLDADAVVGLILDTSRVFDLSPLRALTRLRRLHAAAAGPGLVRHLDALAGLPGLVDLTVAGNPVADLTPLRGLRLQAIDASRTRVHDVGPLRDHPLEVVRLNDTRVKDLGPLKDRPLRSLHFADTLVGDVMAVRDRPLRDVSLDYDPLRGDREWLGSVKTLETVNGKPAADFFRDVDAFEAWVKQTSALKPEERLQAVVAKFRERNRDGAYETNGVIIEDGDVVGIRVSACPLQDLSPLRALPRLRLLTITEYGFHGTRPLDLRPLAGMRLAALSLVCARTTDLTPLKGMPFVTLYLPWSQADDLSPLKGAPLKSAQIGGRSVRDLSPLAGAPLTALVVSDTAVADLGPLKKAPIEHLNCQGCPVQDFGPCAQMPLREIGFDYYPGARVEPLRAIKTLASINGKPAGEFWKQLDAK